MSSNDPYFVDFTITRPEPNIVIIVLPEQIIFLNFITSQALIVPAGVLYQAAVDEFQLGD
jgi:hypothetical protein